MFETLLTFWSGDIAAWLAWYGFQYLDTKGEMDEQKMERWSRWSADRVDETTVKQIGKRQNDGVGKKQSRVTVS